MYEQTIDLVSGLERMSADRLATLGVYVAVEANDSCAKVLVPMEDGSSWGGHFGP